MSNDVLCSLRTEKQTHTQTDTKVTRGHPFRVSGVFPSSYHQGSAQLSKKPPKKLPMSIGCRPSLIKTRSRTFWSRSESPAMQLKRKRYSIWNQSKLSYQWAVLNHLGCPEIKAKCAYVSDCSIHLHGSKSMDAFFSIIFSCEFSLSV